MEVAINPWAVMLGTVFSMGLGFLWYGPLFAKQWMKLAKVSQKQVDDFNPFAMAVSVVGSVMVSYVVAHVAYLSYDFYRERYLYSAITASLLLFVGLQFFVFLMHDAFEGRRKKLTLLNVGYEFVRIVGVGLIIGFMGVV